MIKYHMKVLRIGISIITDLQTYEISKERRMKKALPSYRESVLYAQRTATTHEKIFKYE